MKPFALAVLLVLSLPTVAGAQGSPYPVAGLVTDAVTGAPIGGATVRERGAAGPGVTSDADGRFRLTLGGPGTIVASRMGYASREREVTGPDPALMIALVPLGRQDSREATAQSLEGLTVRAVRAGGEAPIAQTTLDRTRLERDYSGQDIPLSVRQAPSVTAFSESGSLLNYSYFRIRGIDQSRINITLDGVPLNEPEEQQIYFSDFPDLTSSVQSVQVQRGVGTSTYGQAAFGGSVNFATHSLSGAPREVALHLGGGSFGMQRATLEAFSGMIGDRLSTHVRVSGMRSDGYREGASSAANSVFASAGYLGDRDLLKLTVTTGLERNGQAYAAVPADVLRDNPRANPIAGVGDKYRESLATVSYTRFISPSASAGVTAYGFATRGFYDYPSGSTAPALRFRSASRWVGLVAATHVVSGRLTIDGGAHGMSYSKDHEFEGRADLQYPGYANTGFKTEGSVFGKANLALGAVGLFGDLQLRTAEFRYQPTAGYGLDEVSQRWSFLNPKVGVTARVTDQVRLFASAGTTGREPTRGDLFAGADDVTPADAAELLPLTRVRPEYVNDFEAGATLSSGRLSATVTVFDMRFRDEIARTGATTMLGYDIRANVGRSYRRGVELEALARLTRDLDAGSSFTLSRNRIASYRDEGSGDTHVDVEPILTPAFLASHHLTWRATPRLAFTADSRYQGRSALAPVGDARLASPAFHVLDGGIRLELPAAALLVHGRNLLDRRAYPSGDVSSGGVPRFFILAPRSVDISVTLRR